ncbi:MAG: discoidin domain-containing protein, partial [Acidobacteriia bacterium]|nr:discoidin domain-containing protein [Terriglobia bacterium]
PPHEIQLDLGTYYAITGFQYLPRQDLSSNGNIAKYEFYVSMDGVNWGTAVSSGTLMASSADHAQKQVTFPGVAGRYVRLRALSEVNGWPWTNAAELNVLGWPLNIPHTAWRVLFVDSEATDCGNYGATSALDGNATTMWLTEWCNGAPPPPHEIGIDLGGFYSISGFQYLPRQDLSSNGNIARYEFYVSADGTNWGTAVSSGTLMASSADRTLKEVIFPTVAGRYVRLRALSEVSGRPWANAAELNVLGVAVATSGPQVASVTLNPGSIAGGGNPTTATVTLASAPATNVTLTVASSNTSAATVPATVTVNAGATAATFAVTSASLVNLTTASIISATLNGSAGAALLMITPTVTPKTGWRVLYVDSQATDCGNYGASNALDGNAATMWTTEWCHSAPPPPHEIQLDLGTYYAITGFQYLPRQDLSSNGNIANYEFYVSMDGVNWGMEVSTGTLITNPSDHALKQVIFPGVPGRYVRLRAMSEVNGGPWTNAAEINFLGTLLLPTLAPVAMTTTTLPTGTIHTGYQASLAVTGGAGPYTWSLASGMLPAGLALSSTGVISGTPTQSGYFVFAAQVTDFFSSTQTGSVALQITAGAVSALRVTTTTLPAAIVSSPYHQQFTTSGGAAPFTWGLLAGSHLPAGLSFSSTGELSGIPTQAGTFSFGVEVMDSTMLAASLSLSLAVGTADSPFEYVMGDSLFPYSTEAKPAKGGTFTDSTYHVPVTLVSGGIAEGNGSTVVNYSTWNPLSSDGNYLLFNGSVWGRGFVLYDAHTYAYVRAIPSLDYWNGQDPEPRWDYSGSHPSWIYYRKDKQLRYYDVSDDTDNLVHDFTAEFPFIGPSYYIYNGQEGSPSRDSRHWAWMLQNQDSPYDVRIVFTWDKQTETVLGAKDVSAYGVNNVMMSPSGQYVYVAYKWTGHGGEFDGPHAYRTDFTNPVKPFTEVPHANFGWTKQGHEVIVGGNQFAGPEGRDFVGFTRLDTGQTYPIYYNANLGWNGGGVTLAYTDVQGWTFLSEYGGPYPNPDHWDFMQTWAFELDETKTYNTTVKPRIWRIAFTQCFGGTYDEQANAAMDYSGTRIWWGSNWRNDGAPMDVYQANLPATWATDLADLP